jgi:murein DD-endopeptidase MepM/ murein hydrolase activator NlpD
MASGTITHSLLSDGHNAGLSESITVQLATIFGWDVDFSSRIRPGDRFNVIYETRREDELTGHDIVAAEFINDGTTFRAFRYTDSRGITGYYTQDGRSVRKPFLRSPVNFTRISSPFSLARLHPVLNTLRAHRGVDYAAPTGTPILAAGNGRIVFMGTKGGYGKTIILLHGNTYSTLYGHMSRYAGGVEVGTTVHQGDVIGYVGQTGLATGPHLHYEFRIKGVHHDPVSVRLPEARPLPLQERIRFVASIQPTLARLDTNNSVIASARSTDN